MGRLLRLVEDRRNLTGLAAAAAGLGMYFGGVIESGWLAIVAGLYGAGFLGASLLPRAAGAATPPAPVDELVGRLRALARRVDATLPPSARAHLTAILEQAREIEPRLATIDPANPSVDQVRRILADYIPTTLTAYAALPASVARGSKLMDGRTPAAAIVDQLALLDAQMKTVAEALSAGDLAALETQGRFLELKFDPAEPLFAPAAPDQLKT